MITDTVIADSISALSRTRAAGAVQCSIPTPPQYAYLMRLRMALDRSLIRFEVDAR